MSHFTTKSGDFLGKLKKDNATLYLIVYGEVMDRILSQDKTIEYRECTDYWKQRIEDKPYSAIRLTNGYGNDTRRYVLARYMGYDVVNRNGTPHYAIPINRELWKEYREITGGKVKR